ncbi:PEP-CTERM sorting domain-containing protein [Mucisphaera calidilacus]|uniref:Ice-binding protein C-terminal domain-containing protein n=1 Tax=Mucisphaera calidilacus TaxID=2527982 RepID=A0A518BUI4_9BACT|nr:PEP-CTERM sorting domain-containing protein [Mucisphaera calidilacus]QDU70594.1 hypothetical protein Pan265_04220 [Mucisphaera calidilacus]
MNKLAMIAGIALAGTAATAAQAAFSVTLQAGVLKDALGDSPLVGGTLALIADVEGDGIGSVEDMIDSPEAWLTDDDDILLDLVKITEFFGTQGFVSADLGPFEAPANSKIVFAFYNNNFDEVDETTGPGFGVEFASYDGDFILTNPNASGFFVSAVTNDLFGGTLTPETLYANDGVTREIPEPASLALLGLGALAIARRQA